MEQSLERIGVMCKDPPRYCLTVFAPDVDLVQASLVRTVKFSHTGGNVSEHGAGHSWTRAVSLEP